MTDLDQLASTLDLQHREWKAWQLVIDELKPLCPDGDIHDPIISRAILAIEAWAEQLVALRVEQSDEQRAKAREEKNRAYVESFVRQAVAP